MASQNTKMAKTEAAKVAYDARRNRDAYKKEDETREKCVKFVHGEQWDEATESERTAAGLTSLVADRTLEVYKILDGFSRKNQTDVKFISFGDDGYHAAELRNKVFAHLRQVSDLPAMQAKAFGLAAVTDFAYCWVHPETNVLGETNPAFFVPGPFECYPDHSGTEDPIWMEDAQHIDLHFWMSKKQLRDAVGPRADKQFLKRLDEWNAGDEYDEDLTMNEASNTEYDQDWVRHSETVLLYRFSKKRESKRFAYNLDTMDAEEVGDEEDGSSFEGRDEIYFPGEHEEEDTLWVQVLAPGIDSDTFIFDEAYEFQPIDLETGKVRWPIVRFPFLWVAGKAIGAIRPMIGLQEARNVTLSALLNHIQKSANGGMWRKAGIFNGSDNKDKFDLGRGHPGQTVIMKEDFDPDRDWGELPKGESSFADGGQFLEEIINQIIPGITGAQPVMQGKAQGKTSPARLFEMQNQNAQDSMLGVTESYRDFQYAIADLSISMVRQFWDGPRLISISGTPGSEEELMVNQQTAEGLKNDVSQGLYKVAKTEMPSTETSRRQRLAENLDLVQRLGEIGLPPFIQDLETIIENSEMPPDRKIRVRERIQQWQALQGVGEQAAQQQAMAQAQQAQTPQEAQGPQALAPVV